MLLRSKYARPSLWLRVGLSFLVVANVLHATPHFGFAAGFRGHDFLEGLCFGIAIGCLLGSLGLRHLPR